MSLRKTVSAVALLAVPALAVAFLAAPAAFSSAPVSGAEFRVLDRDAFAALEKARFQDPAQSGAGSDVDVQLNRWEFTDIDPVQSPGNF